MKRCFCCNRERCGFCLLDSPCLNCGFCTRCCVCTVACPECGCPTIDCDCGSSWDDYESEEDPRNRDPDRDPDE